MKVSTLPRRIRTEVSELSELIDDELRRWREDNLPEDLFHSDLLPRVLPDYLMNVDLVSEGAVVAKLFNLIETLMQEADENVVNAVEVYFGEALLSNRKLYSKVQPYFGPLLKQDMERMKSALGLKW